MPAAKNAAQSHPHDPRPLIGEPLALDLLNTRWMQDGQLQDLLTDTEGLAIWLASNALDTADTPDTPGTLDAAADATTLRHTLRARDALEAAVAEPASGPALAQVDEILTHGRIRPTLTLEGPGEIPEFRSPAWGPAWLAARNYLELLTRAPDRIRGCAHPDCVLHFFDTSKNGTRRWCSMAACGNRAKASRHYARSRATD